MRNLLALVAALALIFLGLGWYLDWYRINTSTTGDGHRQFNIDVNTDRIKTDVGSVFERKEGTPPAGPSTPEPKTTPATPTGFQREDGWFVFPETFTPVPPGSGPKLPPPR